MVEGSCIVDFTKTTGRSEDIDIKLIDQVRDFLKDKNAIKDKVELEKLETCCDNFKSFLCNIREDESTDSNLFLEKQKYASELLKQILISVDPYLLSKEHTKYFLMLQKFQELAPKHLDSYRDHLIHSLRVFFLIIAIFRVLEEKNIWIEILKSHLADLLKKLDRDIDPNEQLERLNESDLWIYSICGGTLMSLFHDLGIVYSKFREIIDKFVEDIFGASGNEDLSLFDWRPQLKNEYKHLKEKILPIFKDLSDRYHPEYDKLFKTLRKDLEKIRILDKTDTHGTLSLFLIFHLYYKLESVILDSSCPLLKKKYEEAASRPQLNSGRMSTKERIVGDDVGNESLEKLKDVVDELILYEVMNAIFTHNKEGYVALSPFSEILVFADNSQEWDRFEYKEGDPIKYTKDKIRICANVDGCEDGKTILSFYEETSFQETSTLNNVISQLSNVLKDTKGGGFFGIFFHIKVDENSPYLIPSRALFRCKNHPQIFDDRNLGTREEIDIRDFCRKCRKKLELG